MGIACFKNSCRIKVENRWSICQNQNCRALEEENFNLACVIDFVQKEKATDIQGGLVARSKGWGEASVFNHCYPVLLLKPPAKPYRGVHPVALHSAQHGCE